MKNHLKSENGEWERGSRITMSGNFRV